MSIRRLLESIDSMWLVKYWDTDHKSHKAAFYFDGPVDDVEDYFKKVFDTDAVFVEVIGEVDSNWAHRESMISDVEILEDFDGHKTVYSEPGYDYVKVSGNHYLCRKDDGEEYSIDKEGTRWQCSCPAFRYRQKCKHITTLLDNGIIKPEKERQPIERMEDMKAIISPIISKYDSDWEIVGSYRRGKSTFKDVDILVHCTEEKFKELANELKGIEKFDSAISGSDLIRGIYHEDGLDIDLDINRVYTDEPAAFLLYRTGPAELNTLMRRKAMSYGWSLSEKGLLDHITGQKVPGDQSTEEGIFNLLNLPYLTPEQRENFQSEWDVSSIESQIKRDMQTNVYGPAGIIDDIADRIRENSEDILFRYSRSVAKDKRAALVRIVKPYIEDIVKYPYSGEIVAAFERATGQTVPR